MPTLPAFGQLVVPPYSSNPFSFKRVYFDFGGFLEKFGNSTTLTEPFSLDGFTTFSATELATLVHNWLDVADDYAPFNVNVTTIEHAPLSEATDVRVVIGANNLWLPLELRAAGTALIGSPFDSKPNVWRRLHAQ